MAPLQPYESPHDCLVCLHFSDGEFENLVKPMVGLSIRNANWENLRYYQTHECWVPHNYSEVLLALLVSLVPYVEWLCLTIWGRLLSSLTFWSIKSPWKFHSLFCFLIVFVSFWAIFGSTLPVECYLYLSWGGSIYLVSKNKKNNGWKINRINWVVDKPLPWKQLRLNYGANRYSRLLPKVNSVLLNVCTSRPRVWSM